MGTETEPGPWDISCLMASGLIISVEVVGMASMVVETEEDSRLSLRAFKAVEGMVRKVKDFKPSTSISG